MSATALGSNAEAAEISLRSTGSVKKQMRVFSDRATDRSRSNDQQPQGFQKRAGVGRKMLWPAHRLVCGPQSVV